MYNIRDLFLFKGLDDNQLDEIISGFQAAVTFKKGDEIYSHNRFHNAMGVILSGSADALDASLLKKSFNEGGVFGVAALYNGDDEYISSIVAKSDCTVLFIYEDMLSDIFRKYPDTSLNYITFLSGRIRFLNKKIKLFTCGSTSSRLYQYFSENADESGIFKAENMSRIAKITSIGRTSLYRAVDELEAAGMIEKNGTQIIIK